MCRGLWLRFGMILSSRLLPKYPMSRSMAISICGFAIRQICCFEMWMVRHLWRGWIRKGCVAHRVRHAPISGLSLRMYCEQWVCLKSEAYASIRFSFSEFNTVEDVDETVVHLARLCEQLRRFSRRRLTLIDFNHVNTSLAEVR